MAMKISQREARRIKKRLADMEEAERRRYSKWCSDFPGGTHMQSLTLSEIPAATLNATSRLGFVMVGKIDGNILNVYAVKP